MSGGGKEQSRAELKGKAVDLLVHLCSNLHLCPWAVGREGKNKIQAVELSFLRRESWLTLRDRVRSLVIKEELRVDPLLLCMERNKLKCSGYLWAALCRLLPREPSPQKRWNMDGLVDGWMVMSCILIRNTPNYTPIITRKFFFCTILHTLINTCFFFLV